MTKEGNQGKPRRRRTSGLMDDARRTPLTGAVAPPVVPAEPFSPVIPLSDGLAWFTELVGSFRQGHGYLLGGAPGAAKSKFAIQLGVDVATRGGAVTFLLTEETEARLRSRIRSLLWDRSASEIADTLSRVHVEDGLTNIELLPQFVASHIISPAGRFHGSKLLVIDSLMGHGLPATSARRWERLFDGLRLCREADLTTFSVAHVNKSNMIGGPRTLTHNLDTVLVLRQLGNYRLMFAAKNRDGPADARRPARLILNPVSLALEPAPLAETQVVAARSYLPGSGVVEVQAAVSLSLGTRRRIIGSSLPHAEVEQLLDTIAHLPGVELNDTDFSISCRVPGQRGYKPTLGLALCVALVGSVQQRTIPTNCLFLGEVDLQRRVRDVPDDLTAELIGAISDSSVAAPLRVACSPRSASNLSGISGVIPAPCRTLDEAIFSVWPDTR